MDKYDDIINLPHYRSKRRGHMTLSDRAAQFMSFKALTGYEDEISETARLTDKKLALNDEAFALLNERIAIIKENISKKPPVEIIYFIPDEKKKGGAYITVKGNVRRIDEIERLIIFTDKEKIPIDDVYKIKLIDKTSLSC